MEAEGPARAVFLNPWDRLIGPNRYLVELLRPAPELARRSLVALPLETDAADEYRQLGCEVVSWPEMALVHPRATGRHLVHLLSAHTVGVARMRRHLAALAPGVVVSNGESLWLGGMAARTLGIPHLQVFHTLTFEERLGRRPLLLRAYLRFLVSWNARLVAVSRTVADALERGGAPTAKVHTLPNPLPAELPVAAPGRAPELAAPGADRAPLLLCAGRISPMKGQDLLVEALPRVRERFQRLLCCFAGRVGSPAGAEDTAAFARRLRARVGELGLEDAVRFLGECEHLPELLRRADLYVQPSRTESFGRVVAEALLCETPVVAFAVGGVPETAGPGALLAPAGDPGALADAILTALARPEEARRRARRGREHVQREYGAPAVAGRFLELLSELRT